ncbi:MAG: hypothetical protein ABSC51_09775 [Gaiellaceae bacterium]|jgi:hypothetical protein
MNASTGNKRHTHRKATVRVLRQREGVPYEVERTVCLDCRKILSERPLRRAAA